MGATRILIVDDHPLFREALKQAISGGVANASVTLAGSLDAATVILDKDDEFDLILLDLRMPGVQGLSANNIWQDYQNRLHELEFQKQSLAIAELAVGRMTLEVLAGSKDGVGADRRLEKIRKGIALRFEEERAMILEGKNHLQSGAALFERQIRDLAQRENELTIRSGDLAVAQADFDETRQEFERDKMLNLEAIKILQGRNNLLEAQIADLKLQVEKLHAVLIDETSNVKTPQAPTLRIAA